MRRYVPGQLNLFDEHRASGPLVTEVIRNGIATGRNIFGETITGRFSFDGNVITVAAPGLGYKSAELWDYWSFPSEGRYRAGINKTIKEIASHLLARLSEDVRYRRALGARHE
jgi:hypothetical protein